MPSQLISLRPILIFPSTGQNSSTGRGEFSLFCVVHTTSYPVGSRSSSSGAKQLECEADYSRPATVEIKNTSIYTSTLLYTFMTLFLIRYAQGELNFALPTYRGLPIVLSPSVFSTNILYAFLFSPPPPRTT
jgi:hypothetical protein